MMPFREGYGAGEIDLIEFTDILIKHCLPVQIDQILQEITDRYHRGCCPICGSDEQPVDKKSGKRPSYMDDISLEQLRKMDDVEWHEMHEVDCFVTLIEEMRSLKPVEK